MAKMVRRCLLIAEQLCKDKDVCAKVGIARLSQQWRGKRKDAIREGSKLLTFWNWFKRGLWRADAPNAKKREKEG